MKPSQNLSGVRSLLMVVLCTISFSLFGQTIPEIDIRFANPAYDRTDRTYTLDVEVLSEVAPEQLFGMNFRFYYDASMISFTGIDQFHPGYGILGEAPKGIVGNEESGSKLFSFHKAAGYVNTSIILVSESNPLAILTNEWSKVCRVSFKVPVTTWNKENFCPSVVWDLEQDQNNGGFLPGAGLVITVVDRDRSSRFESAPAKPVVKQFNWAYDEAPGLPFGVVSSQECISVETPTYTEEQEKTKEGYALFQNQPNPFEAETSIEFILPSAQEATIVFFDVDGEIKETIEGRFEAGKNQIILKKKTWMVQTGVVYYKLVTSKYTSPTLSMTIVRA